MPYEQIEAEFAERMAREGPTEGLLRELTVRLQNQRAQDIAELHAYVTCTRCGRLYTETQWAWLPPDASKPWRNGDTEIEEHRRCEVCGQSLAVVERVLERIRGTPVHAISQCATACNVCRVPIPAGSSYVVRLHERTWQRERGEWCSLKCEGSP